MCWSCDQTTRSFLTDQTLRWFKLLLEEERTQNLDVKLKWMRGAAVRNWNVPAVFTLNYVDRGWNPVPCLAVSSSSPAKNKRLDKQNLYKAFHFAPWVSADGRHGIPNVSWHPSTSAWIVVCYLRQLLNTSNVKGFATGRKLSKIITYPV